MILVGERVTRHLRGARPSDVMGLHLLCPVCFINNTRLVDGEWRVVAGIHAIHCLTPDAPPDMLPLPGRWQIVGDTFDEVSLVAGSSSVLLDGGCNAHFWIRDGAIHFAGEPPTPQTQPS